MTKHTRSTPGLEVGFHTGAFNSAYFSFEKAVAWASVHGLHNIECGFVDGVSWNHGLGYFPHIASWEDPRGVRELLDRHGVRLSQIDAAFPMSIPEGRSVGVRYVIDTIRWAALAGCPMVDTTDGLEAPAGGNEAAVMSRMREDYARIVEVAERYGVTVTIETHGHFTANPDRLEEMLGFVDSDLLRLTFDTGNVFISGQEPLAFLRRFADRVSHVHLKDVAPTLAESSRGKQSGIGMSHVSVGGGVNASNIVDCLRLLFDSSFSGAASLECEARGGPLMAESASWLVSRLDEIGYVHDVDEPVLVAAERG